MADAADIRSGRLSAEVLAENFRDMHPPLSRSEALIEADRCYFCHDAPCTIACPTDIDIPQFIQKIRSDNLRGSARTILSENIMGGMCARVCPTEVLCEQACVRNTHEDKPVNIGLLKRYATDPLFEGPQTASDWQLFGRAASSGKRVAVVGAGPAGLSCAHRLATLGHEIVVFNRDAKPGGLNEYGIAAYKTVDDFARREADFILGIGGIELRNNTVLGKDVTLAELQRDFDAVFLGAGLDGVNHLAIDNEDIDGVHDAVDYIADLRQAVDKSRLPVGRRVVVIGGGMTAIDIAVQSRKLGAEQVDIVYRRGPEHMGASRYEQDFAQTCGVRIGHWAMPKKIMGSNRNYGHVTGVEFVRTALDEAGKLAATDETWRIDADVVFKAVGQRISPEMLGGVLGDALQKQGKLIVDEQRKSSLDKVWAGGDCVFGHDDLTVTAVQDGKVAAIAIDAFLRNGEH
jgi:glutamate synthase (NADPH/NADH) small chain